MRENLASFLKDWARRSRQPAVAQRTGVRILRWSYDDLRGLAFQFSRELEARGIERGDRVLLCGGNSAEWSAGLRLLLRGAIIVP